jgi:hypothetical protein
MENSCLPRENLCRSSRKARICGSIWPLRAQRLPRVVHGGVELVEIREVGVRKARVWAAQPVCRRDLLPAVDEELRMRRRVSPNPQVLRRRRRQSAYLEHCLGHR